MRTPDFNSFFYFPANLSFSSAPSDKDIKKGQALKEEGNALVKKGEHKKAIEKYSQSLKHNPTEVTTYTNRWDKTQALMLTRPFKNLSTCGYCD